MVIAEKMKCILWCSYIKVAQNLYAPAFEETAVLIAQNVLSFSYVGVYQS